jgi:RNA polymerase sigma factor (sigma-70 family)
MPQASRLMRVGRSCSQSDLLAARHASNWFERLCVSRIASGWPLTGSLASVMRGTTTRNRPGQRGVYTPDALGREMESRLGRRAGEDQIDLIQRVKQGDPTAYEELVQRYQGLAFRVAYLITGSRMDAEDAAQQAFIKAYFRIGQLRESAAFRGWLLGIVANEARNRRRSSVRWAELSSRAMTAMEFPQGPEGTVLEAEEYREVLRAVKGMEEPDRLAIACRYFLDLSEAETAKLLGWRRGTVKSRLSRALSRLRSKLAEERPNPEGRPAEEGFADV